MTVQSLAKTIKNLISDYTQKINNKADKNHTHDDRYYTETEIDTKLNNKANSSHGNHVPTTETANNARFLRNDNTWQTVTAANIGAAASGHTHSNYLTGITKTMVTTALGYTPPTTDTNTWRGIQNNLTSDSTTDSLSAAQGKVLKGLVDGKAASSHTHSNYATTASPTFTGTVTIPNGGLKIGNAIITIVD